MHRVCIVGAGYISSFHMEVLQGLPDTQVVGVCDTHLERARSFAEKWAIPKVFRSVDEVITGQWCNFAHVLVPPHLHRRVAEPLLKAGINVFLEKPMGVSSEECDALMEAARMGNAHLGVNHNALFHPAYLAAKEQLRANRLGHLHHLISFLNVPLRQLSDKQFGHWMFQLPQNLVLEQGVHPLSQIYDLAGPLIDVHTMTSGLHEPGPGRRFYDTWQISMICEKATAQLFMSLGQDFPASGLIAIGEDGLVQVDLVHNRSFIQSKTQWPEFYDAFQNEKNLAREVAKQSLVNLGRYLLSTLRMIPRSDPFFLGMKNSIAAFYEGVDHEKRFIDGKVGSDIVRMCERISREVAGEIPPDRPRAHPRSLWASASLPEKSVFSEKADLLTGDLSKTSYDALVIGGTGFIGSHLVKRLLAANLRIKVLARNTQILPSLFHDPRIELISGDIADEEVLRKAIKDVPIVVHLAQGSGGDSWDEIKKSMVAGTRNVAEACIQNGIRRLIYVSTIACLYLGEKGRLITGRTRRDPKIEKRGLYARGKAACEELLNQLHQEKNLPVCILRPGIVIGEGGSPFHSGLGQFNRDAHCIGWNDGKNPLPFVLVEDVAEAIFSAMYADSVIGKSYNVVGEVCLSAREYINQLARVLGRPLKYHPQSLLKLHCLEIGKWLIKRGIGRKDASFPSYRDLKSRGLVSPFDGSDIKRDLKWTPTQDRAQFISQGIEVHRKKDPAPRHLLHIFSTFGIGGPQVRTCQLINHFGSRYKHTIIAMDGNYACKTRLKKGLDVEFVPLRVEKKKVLKNFLLFRRVLSKIKPDLLVTYNWGAIEWGMVNRFLPLCPHIHMEDGFGPDERATQKKLRVWARRFFLSQTYKIVVPSKTLQRIALQVWQLKEGSVAYIPNGVDCEKYAKRNPPLKVPGWEVYPSHPVVGTVAILRKEKNLLRLIRVFSKLSPDLDARLLIVGDGPEYGNLSRYIEENKLHERVKLLGHLEDPSDVIKALDIFAISSDTEQMPLSVLEAMAAGCPIVGMDVGDVKEMVSPENSAYISPKFDEDHFKRMLEKLLVDKPLRLYLGEQNRIKCRKFFEKDLMFQAYEKLYDLKL